MPSAPLLTAALLGLVAGCGSGDGRAEVTSSEVDGTMTLALFTARCDAAGGELETHPHCGGVNTCRGFSYDETTQVLTEHTCKATNTCAGYSCVLGD